MALVLLSAMQNSPQKQQLCHGIADGPGMSSLNHKVHVTAGGWKWHHVGCAKLTDANPLHITV
jgi:hypothetical protein